MAPVAKPRNAAPQPLQKRAAAFPENSGKTLRRLGRGLRSGLAVDGVVPGRDLSEYAAILTKAQMQANFERALDHMSQLKEGKTPAQLAARKIARALEELGIPYVVAGGLALRPTDWSARPKMSV